MKNKKKREREKDSDIKKKIISVTSNTFKDKVALMSLIRDFMLTSS